MKVKTQQDGSLCFRCPACAAHVEVFEDEGQEVRWSLRGEHRVHVDPGAGRPVWQWNEDPARPTFSPSVRVRTELPGGEYVCHFFVRQGQIHYCGDSTHALAGQVVEMPDIEEVDDVE